MARILVVDDEPALREYLARALRQKGHQVSVAADGESALAALAAHPPEILLLDLSLPDRDGMEVLRLLRAGDRVAARTPVLLISGRGLPSDRVRGLRAGGDDFLVKPFDTEELLARIEALLRRAAPARSAPETACLWREFGDLILDCATQRAWSGGRWSLLTPVEFRLLRDLMDHPGEPRSPRDLMEAVWDYPPEAEGDPALVRWYVGSLRKKIEEDPKNPRRLVNLPRRGYALVADRGEGEAAPEAGRDPASPARALPSREPMELLSAIASATPDGLFVLDARGRVIFWNEGAARLFDRPRETMLGETFSAHFSAFEDVRLLSLSSRDLAGPSPPGERLPDGEVRETFLAHRDGTTIPVELTLSPFLLWEEPYVLGIARDVSERLRAEAIRREGEERIRRTLDAVPLMASYLTLEGEEPVYVYVNRAYESYFRRPHGTMRGRRVEEVIGPEGYRSIRPHVERVRSGSAATFRYVFSFPELGPRHLDVRLLPDFDAGERVRGCYAFLIDATDYRELEEELFFARFELERLRRAAGAEIPPGTPFPSPIPLGTRLARYDLPRLSSGD
jgi:PAS domain S-box-containing protein